MIFFLFFFVFFFFCVCLFNNNLSGKYMSKNNPNYIELRKDHSFIYEYRSSHLYQQSIGQWQKIGAGLIVLNSNIKNTDIPIRISTNTKSDDNINQLSVKLTIAGSKSLMDYKCVVYINDEIYCTRRADSMSLIRINPQIKSIYFTFIKEPQIFTTTYVPFSLSTNTYIFKERSKFNLEVDINFPDSYFYYRAFDNDTLKIRSRGVAMFNKYNSRWEKLLKVPDSSNLFSRYTDTSKKLNNFRNW